MAAAAPDELRITASFQEMPVVGVGVSPPVAVAACMVMALGYVLVLYVPTAVLRLSPPASLESFLIRRFICALVFSAISALASAALLGVGRDMDISVMLSFFGIRKDHMWQAVVFPLLLASLLYAGSLASKLLLVVYARREREGNSWRKPGLCKIFSVVVRSLLENALASAHNVVAWRNYVVAPFTEELVFRACMIPLLLCSGFRIQTIIFIGPVSFSLAHLNHFMELYYPKRRNFLKACSIVGIQLGYTVVFGWYASFLFLRTGNLISAVVAHIVCNVMGLPIVLSPRTRGMYLKVGVLWL
ncbi:CAAX prenyl protease 2 isoform X2 [Phalaenopsis equestris]|uniref:CAAX prenyl protease 2 isoform X2 n=1 Tax=Phalaenopsis equestris TaxID=78828 RepID=UPI0009E40E07|nr:CAAX prenyl protease 2 isoform X2 [Phalaenopsis equestris]